MAPGPRKSAKRNENDETVGPSKEQDEIAKFLRFNCPTNSTLFQGNDVHYFSGIKAVDTLLNSKYGEKAKGLRKFNDRNAVVSYIQELMDLQMFFRAKKLVPKKKEKKDEDKKDGNNTETDQEEKKEESKPNEPEKKKKKVKLEVHATQVFNDDKDVYVWVFDPTPLHKKIIGLLMVVGTIVGCLFPLWPMWLRQGVWYLSLVGLGAFAAILITAVLRTILFGIIWLFSWGQHKLWILPNLTEDCGFFESFKPWYTYEYCPRNAPAGNKKDEKKKDKKKDKNSDGEESAPLLAEASAASGDASGGEEASEKAAPAEGEVAEESAGSASDDNASQEISAGSSSEASAPPSPSTSGQPRKRRARKADDGFVHVK